MTQTYKVQVSMNQAHLVESGFVWKQGDFGFNLEIEVMDFDTSGVTPQIIFRKSSGAVESTSITQSSNKFTYTFAGTELDSPGPGICDLKLKNSTTQRISTASFKFFVIPDTEDGLNEQATSYSDTISQVCSELTDQVDKLIDAAVDETRNIFDYASLNSNLTANAVVFAKKDSIEIKATTSGTPNARCVFVTNKKVSQLADKTLYITGNLETTTTGTASSYMVQVGIYENNSFSNKQTFYVSASGGAFTFSWAVPSSLISSNPNANIAVRLYQGYGLTVTTSDTTTYRNLQIETDRTTRYVNHLSAVDSELKAGSLYHYGNITTSGLNLNNGDFIHSGIWNLVDVSNYKPANYPSDNAGTIISFASVSNSSFSTVQIVIDINNTIYERYSNANQSWSNWIEIVSKDYVDSLPSATNAVYNYGNITTSGLDLNSGDFIHPGRWALVDLTKMPAHYPSNRDGCIISFASSSSSSYGTYQIVVDGTGTRYERFSSSNGVWSNWKASNPKHKNIAFETAYTKNETFTNQYNITADWSTSSGRVSRLMALYDAVTAEDVTITKETLGQDASDTFDIYNYKISNGIGNKPIVLLIVGEHGDEMNSAMLGYYVYNEIVTGLLKKYLKFVDFWVIPLMNPYGYENSTRNNANDVNLNRDFPCMWEYSNVEHNKTGNYSLSQPESVLIYNLIVNNKDKILFLCNKHDTGSITKKINNNQPDKCCYTNSILLSDSVINRGLAKWQDAQVKETDPWIVTECDVDLSGTPLIISRDGHTTAGALDLFANSIGVHGSLLECCIAAGWDTETPAHYETNHTKDMARIGLDYFVNYISQTIENNKMLLDDDSMLVDVKYYTRREIDGTWALIEQYWNGNALVDVT